MEEKDDDIAHPGMVSKPEKHVILALNRLIFERKSVLQASDFFFLC
jgi:hypothetical protein